MTKTKLRSSSALSLVPFAALVLGGCALEGAEGEPEAFSAALSDGVPVVGLAGKCLDNNGGATHDGNKIQLYTCNGSGAQRWSYHDGTFIGPEGKCLDVQGGNPANGTPVQLWGCNGSAAQQWAVEGDHIVGVGGKCLDVKDFNPDDGAPLQIWECTGGDNQRWSVGGGQGGASFDVKAFLAAFVPNTTHEGFPHGVPTYYDWQSRAIGGPPVRPSNETTSMNWWGEVYADLSDYRAPNTRVAIKGGKLLVLYEGASQWETLQQGDGLGGGAWTEDFTTSDQAINMRVEPDGSRSVITTPGHNAHFWPDSGFALVPSQPRAVMSIAHARLVVADPSQADDRNSSKYIIALGADWRKPDGSCPSYNGVVICTGAGHGKYIRPTTQWRTVVMTSMSAEDLETMPLPPREVFEAPDGTYPAP